MKKILLVLGSIILLIILLSGLKGATSKNDDEYVKKYLLDHGYEAVDTSDEEVDKSNLHEDDEVAVNTQFRKVVSDIDYDTYNKQVEAGKDSEYTEYYYDISTKEFIKNNFKTYDGMSLNLNITYLFDNQPEYIYDISMESFQVILEGKYDLDKKDLVSCEIAGNQTIDDNSKSIYCDKVKLELSNFSDEIDLFLANPRFKKNVLEK